MPCTKRAQIIATGRMSPLLNQYVVQNCYTNKTGYGKLAIWRDMKYFETCHSESCMLLLVLKVENTFGSKKK